MARRQTPNQREALILGLLARKRELFSLEIRNQYTALFGRLPLGSLYTTMDRMEERGLVTSRMGEATLERGGQRRKYFRITAKGESALDAYAHHVSLFQSLITGAATRTLCALPLRVNGYGQ